MDVSPGSTNVDATRRPGSHAAVLFVVCSVLLTIFGLVAWIANGDGYAGCERANLVATGAVRSCATYQTTASWGLLLFLFGVVSFIAAALMLRRSERTDSSRLQPRACRPAAAAYVGGPSTPPRMLRGPGDRRGGQLVRGGAPAPPSYRP